MSPAPKTILLIGLFIVLVAAVLLVSRPGAVKDDVAQPASAPVAEARELRLGLNIAADSALHAAALRFADRVNERSKGRLKVAVFPDQQLGSDDQMLEMARTGKLDLVLTPTAKLSSAIPAMQYADLPFYFSGRDELYAMLDGEPGQMLLSKLESINLVGLAFWENGFKQFTANTPIHRPEDFARLRVRTMKSRMITDQFESLGAKAIPIDFHATYKALAEGAVDAQENPLVAIVGMRFHEVQKHLTLSNHAYLAYVFSINKRVFETLSPDLRDIIQRSARDLTLWERAETARREAGFIETIRAAGVTIHTLTPEEQAAFRMALAPMVDRFGLDIGYDLLLKTDELRYRKPPAAPAVGTPPLVIGVDADFSMRSAQGGGAIYRGVQLAVEEVNQAGGVLGTTVRVIGRDHATSSLAGRKNLEYFSTQPGLIGVVGGVQTAVIMDELESIHRLKLPFMIPWGTGSGLIEHDYRPSYTFRASVVDSLAAPFLLERALRVSPRVVVLLERSAWGRSNEAVLAPLIEKMPAGRVEIEWFNVSDPATEALINTISRGDAGAMVLVANALESQKIVQALARQGKTLPVFAHVGLTSGDFWKNTQQALKTVDLRFVQSILESDAERQPKLKKFIDRYHARYALDAGAPIPSLIATAHAYDLTHLLLQAVRQAKSSDREALRNALEALRPTSGSLRDYNPAFTAERHDALSRAQLRLARFDHRGRIVAAE